MNVRRAKSLEPVDLHEDHRETMLNNIQPLAFPRVAASTHRPTPMSTAAFHATYGLCNRKIMKCLWKGLVEGNYKKKVYQRKMACLRGIAQIGLTILNGSNEHIIACLKWREIKRAEPMELRELPNYPLLLVHSSGKRPNKQGEQPGEERARTTGGWVVMPVWLRKWLRSWRKLIKKHDRIPAFPSTKNSKIGSGMPGYSSEGPHLVTMVNRFSVEMGLPLHPFTTELPRTLIFWKHNCQGMKSRREAVRRLRKYIRKEGLVPLYNEATADVSRWASARRPTADAAGSRQSPNSSEH